MSTNAELLKLLEYLGIRGYEAKAYLALVELGEATATTVALKAGIPQPRIYEVLDSLLRKGLIEVKIGRPRAYVALPPQLALTSYSERYIGDIRNYTDKLINMLTQMYKSHVKLREPLIWINYSLDSGYEKAKKVINDMLFDGFLSADYSLLLRLQHTITKKVKNSLSAAFAVTVIQERDEDRVRKAFESLDRVEVRFLPTGIVRMLEVDLSDALIFGDNFVMHSEEKELILLTYEIYYFGYWRIGKVTKPFNIKRGMKFTLKHHWLALDIASRAINEGLNVKAEVKGVNIQGGHKTVVNGYVKSVKKSPGDTIRTLLIETKEGNNVSVGGIGATIEDVRAEKITLVIE